MYTALVNNKEYKVQFDSHSSVSGSINGQRFDLDMVKVKDDSFHILQNNKSYVVDVIEVDYKEKRILLKINDCHYWVDIRDEFDALLNKMGITQKKVINEIKAPMPGLVVRIPVKEGDEFKKGDTLIVLEAMKMENNLKAPADGVVKSIQCTVGVAVEKNAVLILLD